MNSDQYLAPIVAGALGFVSGHIAKMDPSVSLAVGGVSAVAGYLISKQDCSRGRKKVVREYEEDEGDNFDSEEAVVPVQSKKKKKKKKNTGKTPKQYKRSSYEEDVPKAKPAPSQKKEKSAEAQKKSDGEDEFAGMSKSQIKKARRKKREEEKKAADAKAAAEAKKLAKKKKRQEARKRKKNTSQSTTNSDDVTQLDNEESKSKEDEDEGWQQTKDQIKRAAKKQEFVKLKAAAEAKKGQKQEQVYVKVPSGVRGKVFGKKQANITTLQDSLGVKMDLPKMGGNHDMVTITGPASQCEKAAAALREIMDKGFCEYTNPGFTSAVISVPEGKIGAMMGSKGKYFIQIISETSVSSLEKDDDAKTVTIVGPADGVMRAKEALTELATQGYSRLTHPTWIKAELPVESEMVPAIIGKKGANIKEITKVTKTRIKTPKNGGGTCVVVGDADKVRLAIEMIQKTIAEQAAPKEPAPVPVEWQGEGLKTDDDLW
mmetsp:Transcript_12266/g.17058  ORF Transcript_12266/g.17058 Transcript_12266/m.17058 type:complete len:488 (+) Transcript_12266:97-1560(+)|eukprot:CAMPEP_0184479324 /NCGR_PEP_ID=MMETSP0113_2-20130426/1093_1 /TAXON_ID=91329 /ORGANISM="Norrisiella sphaerica, Strain BC52" /LENGTH=487 /DNA_ID=CAMNT_0026857379 /DNA_START=92 /DNA_END=1555 /DNA_ORIENTATION=-